MNQLSNNISINQSLKKEQSPLTPHNSGKLKRKRKEELDENNELIKDLCEEIFKNFEIFVDQISCREPIIFTSVIPDKIHHLDTLLTIESDCHVKEMQIKICTHIQDCYLRELQFSKEDCETQLPSSLIPFVNTINVDKINEYMQQKYTIEKAFFKSSCSLNSFTYIPFNQEIKALFLNEETPGNFFYDSKYVDKKTIIDSCEKEINIIIKLIKLNHLIEKIGKKDTTTTNFIAYKMLTKYLYSENSKEFVATYSDIETKEKWHFVLPFLFPSFYPEQNQYVRLLPKQKAWTLIKLFD